MYEVYVENSKKPVETTQVLSIALIMANKYSRKFHDTRKVLCDGGLIAIFKDGVWSGGDPTYSGTKKQPPLQKYYFNYDEWGWCTESEVKTHNRSRKRKDSQELWAKGRSK